MTLPGPPPGDGTVVVTIPRRSRPPWGLWAVLAAVALLAGVLVGVVVTDRDGTGSPAGEIFLEPAAAPGRDPFTPDVGGGLAPVARQRFPAPPDAGPGTGAVTAAAGSEPGLYGGTRDQRTCDPDRLVAFLTGEPVKAGAWAAVLGIAPEEIPGHVDGLTPVQLLTDTRVTNHGFRDGRATPFQAVLEAGTAVMVDERGVPRVRCACGNPLTEPAPVASVRFTGAPWEGFDPAGVTRIAPARTPLTELVLVDLAGEGGLVRPVGSTGDRDRPVPLPPGVRDRVVPTGPGTGGPAASVTTTAPTTTAASAPSTDITSTGTVAASSTFVGFPAPLSVDGDRATSWFSAGPGADGDVSRFRWTAPGARFIEAVTVAGNAAHPRFATGFGFATVDVVVLDGQTEVFRRRFDLPGTPDPDVTARPGVTGTDVVLELRGHEDPACGGFAELTVIGR